MVDDRDDGSDKTVEHTPGAVDTVSIAPTIAADTGNETESAPTVRSPDARRANVAMPASSSHTRCMRTRSRGQGS
jgi:hypothetical protein